MGLFFQTFKAVMVATIADFLYTPIWWYTRGLWQQLRQAGESFMSFQGNIAVDLWLKNIFVPMYGQYDVSGRIISFCMRFIQIIGRVILLMLWAAFLCIRIIFWLVIPIGIGYLIWMQF